MSLNRQSDKKKRSEANSRGASAFLRTIPNQRISAGSSNKNDEWDDSTVTRSWNVLQSKSSFANCLSRNSSKKRNVTFGETQIVACPYFGPSNNASMWYKTSDYDRFWNETQNYARTTRRVMKYAAMNESSYKSSIGLTSPRVLKEYLSSPEEIIGIEHFLAGQNTARHSLICYHRKYLSEEQAAGRRRGEGGRGRCDPNSLAQRSEISSYMAKERAAYVSLLD